MPDVWFTSDTHYNHANIIRPEHLGTHVSQDTQVGEIAEEQK